MITNEGEHVSGPVNHAAQDGANASGTDGVQTDTGSMEWSLNRDDLAEQFLGTVFNAARQSGCELLFEIPGILFYDPNGRAAAMRRGTPDDTELFFVLFNADNGEIRVLEENESPETVRDFTRSYAGVLGMIAGDKRLTAPLLQ